MRFEGKIAIVTGAGQGIGECYAKALAREGAAVAIADIDTDNAGSVASQIGELGGRATAVSVDVGDPDSCAAMTAAVVAELGGVDLLVNNAAIYHSMRTDPLITMDLDYYRHFMEVNLNGALYATRAAYPAMAERGGGAIVNQSSTAAWMPAGAYGLAKAGINFLTHALAHELGGMGIRVNGIAPGITETEATKVTVDPMIQEMLPQQYAIKRMAQPEEMCGACLFLLSDDASYVTGQVVSVDGGQHQRL